MYYDDETRRFNLVSGLVFGLVLGAGVALLGVPQERVPVRKRKRRAGNALSRRVSSGLGPLRDLGGESMGDRLAAAASHLDPRRGR